MTRPGEGWGADADDAAFDSLSSGRSGDVNNVSHEDLTTTTWLVPWHRQLLLPVSAVDLLSLKWSTARAAMWAPPYQSNESSSSGELGSSRHSHSSPALSRISRATSFGIVRFGPRTLFTERSTAATLGAEAEVKDM